MKLNGTGLFVFLSSACFALWSLSSVHPKLILSLWPTIAHSLAAASVVVSCLAVIPSACARSQKHGRFESLWTDWLFGLDRVYSIWNFDLKVLLSERLGNALLIVYALFTALDNLHSPAHVSVATLLVASSAQALIGESTQLRSFSLARGRLGFLWVFSSLVSKPVLAAWMLGALPSRPALNHFAVDPD
jgi:hypothetical protein